MAVWFSEMSVRNLLFHPDDTPEAIISTKRGKRTFTRHECQEVTAILDEIFRIFGNRVYDASYPAFMQRMNIQLDA